MTSAKADFVHLHVHTAYSLLDSTLRLGDLFKKAKEYQMSAIAMTDHGNLFGAIDFYQQAQKAGIKPIIGCELHVAPKSRFDKSSVGIRESSHHLIVLVKNMRGYKNLLKLTTAGYLEGFYYHPKVDKELLQRCHEGLIATSACLHGEIASHLLKGDREAALEAAREYRNIFGEGNFYLEIMENGLPEQRTVNDGILEISRLLSIPVVATSDCHYLHAEDAEAYEILAYTRSGQCRNGKKRVSPETNQQYLRSPAEMCEIFSYCPEAIANTILIAEKCDLKIKLNHSSLNKTQLAEANSSDDHNESLIDGKLKKILSSSSAKSRKDKLALINRYLVEKYGSDHMARICTLKKIGEKSAIRFVGQASSEQAISNKEELMSFINSVKRSSDWNEVFKIASTAERFVTLCKVIYGLYFQQSVHPSSIVVADTPISDHIPLCTSPEGELVSQYSRNDLLALGMRVFNVRI